MSFHNCSVHFYPQDLGEPCRLAGRKRCQECKRREARFILYGNFSDYLCPLCLVELLANRPLRDYWTLAPWRAENVRRMHNAVEFGRTELQEV